jgi:hypothetical protein
MNIPDADQRTPRRRAQDEQIAAEPELAPPELPAGVTPVPMETHLSGLRRRPLAVAGIVENGMVRPLDPTVKLAEHSRVIIVATEST